MESGLLPGAGVVPISRVKDPTLALGSHPGPRFFAVPFRAGLQQMSVFLVMLCVNISFIPRVKGSKTFHDRVRRIDDFGVELPRTVPLELGTDQCDVLW